MDFLGLAGKTVIVTGGNSNIGRGITLGFAEQGANVVVAARDEAQAQKVLQAANALGGNTIFIKTDVTDLDAVQAMVKQTLDKFGKIDILVNNVGWDVPEFFVKTNPARWDKLINVNYRSDLNTLTAVLPHMVERKYGKIVNIGSAAARIGEFKEGVYAGCKAAVIALSKTLAREYGRYGININVVCPALTIPESTEHISAGSLWTKELFGIFTPEAREKAAKAYPLNRLGKPSDIANAVLFMASDRASYMTGQTISVDGGYTMI